MKRIRLQHGLPLVAALGLTALTLAGCRVPPPDPDTTQGQATLTAVSQMEATRSANAEAGDAGLLDESSEATAAPTEREVAQEPIPDTPRPPEPTAEPDLEEPGAATVTYRDEATGFELEHPADWARGLAEQHARGGFVQLEDPEGAPMLDIIVQRWDPTGDLEAFIESRKVGWTSSGFEVLSEERIELPPDAEGALLRTRSPEGAEVLQFFLPIGERYLVLSGSAESAQLEEVARSVRILSDEAAAEDERELVCHEGDLSDVDGVACNVVDGLRSRNTQALLGYMSDPFALAYWRSEGRQLSPMDALTELEDLHLPTDPQAEMTFTIQRSRFPDMEGIAPESLLGPEVDVVLVVFGEGWEPDGAGEAMLLLTEDEAEGVRLQAILLAPDGFDG